MSNNNKFDTKDLNIFGKKLERLIYENHRSIEKFSHENGINKQTLSPIINGKSAPSLFTLFMITKGLEISVGELVRELFQSASIERGFDGNVKWEKQDISDYGENELSNQAFEGHLDTLRYEGWFIDLLKAHYKYTPRQMEILINDLKTEGN